MRSVRNGCCYLGDLAHDAACIGLANTKYVRRGASGDGDADQPGSLAPEASASDRAASGHDIGESERGIRGR